MSTITISSRAYLFMRSMAVQTPLDALVEMVTNADDAYQNKSRFVSRQKGDIEVCFLQPYTILVRDHALGMTAEEMRINLLQVGDYTAVSQYSRGYFSRGAKDISALGDVTFMAIKNGKFSQSQILYSSETKMISENIDATPELYEKCGIDEGQNGFVGFVEVRPEHTSITSLETYAQFKKHVSVRDILADRRLNIVSKAYLPDKTMYFTERMTYDYPPGVLLVKKTFVAPGYPSNAKVTLTLYQANAMIPDVTKDKLLEYGLVVASSARANHAVTCIDTELRTNENMRYIYGRLETTYLRDLLVDFESGNISSLNPFTILDPSRQSGVNFSHPFMQAVTNIARTEVQFHLNVIADKNASNGIQSGSLQSLIRQLEIGGRKMLDSAATMRWEQVRDAQLFKALNDQRLKYVISEERNISMFEVPSEGANGANDPNAMLKIYDKKNPLEGFSLDVKEEGKLSNDDPNIEKKTLIKAYEKETDFRIEFSEKDKPTFKYSIGNENGDVILRIFLKDPFIAHFITKNATTGKIENLANKDAITMISGLVYESLAREILRVRFSLNKDTFVTMTDGNVLHSVFKLFEKEVSNIQLFVQQTMEKFLEDGVLEKDETFVV